MRFGHLALFPTDRGTTQVLPEGELQIGAIAAGFSLSGPFIESSAFPSTGYRRRASASEYSPFLTVRNRFAGGGVVGS